MGRRLEGHYPSVRETGEKERIEMVKEIFSTITGRYDFLNHLLSLRRDIAWRRFAAKRMVFPGPVVSSISPAVRATLQSRQPLRHRQISVTGVDFVMDMLQAGKMKIESSGLGSRICFMQADALALPFPDNVFDVSSIAFGIRNIPDRPKALEEMVRVVVPGGQVLILEMAFTRNWFSSLMYRTYLNRILPRIARRFSLNPAAYEYLADSIMSFPSPAEFTQLMRRAGMTDVSTYRLTYGATYLYLGRKGL